jgi:hypothetical protein
LDQALKDVATSLLHLRDFEQEKNIQLGVIIDEVNLNFQIAANAQDSTKLAVAVTAPPHAPVDGSLALSNENVIAAQRGSSIQVKLKSVITAPLNEVGCFYFIPKYLESKKDCAGAKPASTPTPPGSPAGQQGSQGHALNDTVQGIAQAAQNAIDARKLPLTVADVSYVPAPEK